MQPKHVSLVIAIFFYYLRESFTSTIAENLLEFQESLSTAKNSLETSYDGTNETEADKQEYNLGLANEDLWLNATEYIVKQGFPVEVYEVETVDGYVIKVFRIPKQGPVLILMHGLFNSANDFISSGKDNALAFLASKAGYDVWMCNARGNMYSRKHISLSPDDNEFWNFTWHEIGVYDVSACIDFAILKSGKEKVFYIGHSQGTTNSFVLLSEKPEYNDKMILVIALAPVVYMENLFSPIVRALVPLRDQESFLALMFGLNEFMPNSTFTKIAQAVLCGNALTATVACESVLFLFFGFDYSQTNYTALPLQIKSTPAGSATKQVIHYLQEIHSTEFQQFDYGTNNYNIYGTETPPKYNITKVTARVALYLGANDWLANTKDVEKLSKELPNMVHEYNVPYKTFSHMDFLWAKDAKSLVYDDLFELMANYTAS